ncbi:MULTISPECIES: alpha-1,6-glucosidase domain-containing protein [unclassified Roseateles]|uniref:alpha-1,6-glucosidase domain-containing protein n=1 Tax=unclassified Roseateles TaxID=2626991 RepID=UPI0006F995D6|nr:MULTISPECIES: alpha-1,6-glucosidase domain-containing protein [unclassified Roseateles]KQW43418.1 alpha-1,6-glucosidase [Pelomonas sp. Root405]KRA71156.1 alpha-1,6-glucosidase [Pelomonas sp. Root662]
MKAWADGLARQARRVAGAVALGLCGLLAACGGGAEAPLQEPAASVGAAAAAGGDNVELLAGVPATVAVPRAKIAAVATPGEPATSLRVHYRRADGNHTGWQIHTWNAAQSPNWNAGWNAAGSDSFGVYYDVPLAAASGTVGFLLHNQDNKDNGGADQSYVLQAGANEIWRLEGDSTNYTSNPLLLPAPDITTVRVHYKRFDGAYSAWGLHLWNGSGLDVAALPAGMQIDNWGQPVPLSAMPGHATANGEVVFDIPVLNPQGDVNRKGLEFIIHGMPPNENDKDGRDNNIRVEFSALTIQNQVGHIWLVERDATVYTAPPDLRQVSSTDARAVWLNKSLVKWPRMAAVTGVRLYHSATGQISVAADAPVQGADGYITLDAFTGSVPPADALRFKYVAGGAVFSVRAADIARLPALHQQQLVLVQEDANGKVQNATTAQIAGALDDLYATANNVPDLGAAAKNGSTSFKLWAPTAQNVSLVLTTALGNSPLTRTTTEPMTRDAATGVWSLTKQGHLQGATYRYQVQVFVRGVGLVKNLVTDPYSLGLTMGGQQSVVMDLQSQATKPNGWDQSAPPATVAAPSDLSIYELHVRDFSINDATVPAARRGKYLAFAEPNSNGMKHLTALAAAGLTDVHLLPVFDIASVNEKSCTTPAPSGAPDAESQQAAVAATAGTDCFNWGYDPHHFTTPDGAYASTAANPLARVVEFRQMVQGLNAAGLRVGMDVVYNHTTSSGQNATSVLDKVVPGYYFRYNATGGIERSTCCENTASENLMMAKLMIDSAVTWVRDYRISSLRFDIMGHHPRSVIEALKVRVEAAAGRTVQIVGEGWNFGEVANGVRFVQAEMLSLNGSGIGSFNPLIRDAVRGGGCCDSGSALVANQGYVNGFFYDPNGANGSQSRGELMWFADRIKASLAGSIRSFEMQTSWDANLRLDQIDVGGIPAGWVLEPGEVVNYVENHDNLTLFDNNAFRLPTGTSKEDRARVQILANAINAFSQGVAYFHAGGEALRSKSLDKNSYDSGDWFNRLDWTFSDNNFGVGLPPARDNADNWNRARPLLANTLIKPHANDIAWTRDAFRDLLKIRKSTTLLRLRTADDIKARLSFLNTGSAQEPTVLVGRLNGVGYPGANFSELVYLINVDKTDKQLTLPALAGHTLALHPVHTAPTAGDKRAAQASFNGATGAFNVPARTAVVFVAP